MPEPLAPTRPASQTRPGADTPDQEFWAPPRPPRPGRSRSSRPYTAESWLDRVLDRVRLWRSDPRAGIVALVAVALVAGFAWYRIGLGSTADGSADGETANAPAVDAPSDTSAVSSSVPGPPDASSPGAAVTVHVAGAVVRPGVMELPGGARVIDAVEAAGGGIPEADLDRMNLAAPLIDGQRVLVQRVGDPAAPVDPTGGGASPAPGDPTSGPINVNTATQEQLETLPGIGPTLAEAIIAERDRRGGFRSVNELRDVRGIGDKRFADIEGLVTV